MELLAKSACNKIFLVPVASPSRAEDHTSPERIRFLVEKGKVGKKDTGEIEGILLEIGLQEGILGKEDILEAT